MNGRFSGISPIGYGDNRLVFVGKVQAIYDGTGGGGDMLGLRGHGAVILIELLDNLLKEKIWGKN